MTQENSPIDATCHFIIWSVIDQMILQHIKMAQDFIAQDSIDTVSGREALSTFSDVLEKSRIPFNNHTTGNIPC